LPFIRRVGKHFLITGHPGVETEFTPAQTLIRTYDFALKTCPIGQYKGSGRGDNMGHNVFKNTAKDLKIPSPPQDGR
jgi:hypothetical protein